MMPSARAPPQRRRVERQGRGIGQPDSSCAQASRFNAASVRHRIGQPDTPRLSACGVGIPTTGISTHALLADVEPWSPRCYQSPE